MPRFCDTAPTLIALMLLAPVTMAEIFYWETVDFSATPTQEPTQTTVTPLLLYSVAGGSVRLSLDGGYTWEQVYLDSLLDSLSTSMQISELRVDPLDGDTFYAEIVDFLDGDIQESTWISRDGGASWGILRMWDKNFNIEELILDPYQPGRLYWVTDWFDGTPLSIEVSRDGGRNWTPMTRNPSALAGIEPLHVFPDNRGGLYIVAFNIAYRVDEGGLSVLPAAPLGIDEQLTDLAYNPVTDTLLGSTGQRIFSYPVALGAWEVYPIEPAGREALEFRTITNLVAIPGTKNALYGSTWQFPSGPTSGRPTRFYSPDGGRHWRTIQGNLGELPLPYLQLISDGDAPALYASTVRGLYRLRLNASDIWWNPATSGQGMVLSQTDNLVWGNWYGYDGNGQPRWLNYQGELVGNRVEADLWQFRGPPLGTPWDPTLVQASVVGSLVITFDSAVSATFDYTLPGSSDRLAIQPFQPGASGLQNGVWWEAATAGQGLSVVQVEDLIQGGWYTYDRRGDPRWLVFTGTLENGQLNADLLEFTGPALGQAWDPTQLASRGVGEVKLTITSARAMNIEYRWDGVSGTLMLTPFRR